MRAGVRLDGAQRHGGGGDGQQPEQRRERGAEAGPRPRAAAARREARGREPPPGSASAGGRCGARPWSGAGRAGEGWVRCHAASLSARRRPPPGRIGGLWISGLDAARLSTARRFGLVAADAVGKTGMQGGSPWSRAGVCPGQGARTWAVGSGCPCPVVRASACRSCQGARPARPNPIRLGARPAWDPTRPPFRRVRRRPRPPTGHMRLPDASVGPERPATSVQDGRMAGADIWSGPDHPGPAACAQMSGVRGPADRVPARRTSPAGRRASQGPPRGVRGAPSTCFAAVDCRTGSKESYFARLRASGPCERRVASIGPPRAARQPRGGGRVGASGQKPTRAPVRGPA